MSLPTQLLPAHLIAEAKNLNIELLFTVRGKLFNVVVKSAWESTLNNYLLKNVGEEYRSIEV